MKKLLSILLISILCCGWSPVIRNTAAVARLKASGGAADYVPATASVACGGDLVDGWFFVSIYDSSRNLLCSTGAQWNSEGTVNLSFSGASALTPASNYYINITCAGSQYFKYSTSMPEHYTNTGTYPSAPDPLGSGTWNSKDFVPIQIKNAGGDLLIGNASLAYDGEESYSTNIYKGSTYTCATL